MLQNGVYVDKVKPGDWRVCRTAQAAPPTGSVSATSYPTQAEALAAAREGNYE